MKNKRNIANNDSRFNKVSLISPTKSHYIHLAAEIDKPIFSFFPIESRKKKEIISESKKLCKEIEKIKGLKSAVVFKAKMIPPGKGEYLDKKPKVHIAKFDLVILIEAESSEVIKKLKTNNFYKKLKSLLKNNSSYFKETEAKNARRIGSVNHKKQGVFLFNYFVAENTEQMLGIWEYTAGWFQEETGLDNSVLLLPINKKASQYSVINHCRWNSLSKILPSIIFKKSFHKFVLKNFEANNVAAIPVLYKLV